MNEYIERGALLTSQRWDGLSLEHDKARAKEIILCQPAADVVAVKHGEWLEPIWDSDWHSMNATCSHCRERGEVRVKRNLQNILVIDSPRCPACGAFMRGRGGADNVE